MKTFPNFKVRASSSGKLMTDPKEKTNLEKYNDACDKLLSLDIQYENFKNKECKSAIEIINVKIPETKKLIAELEVVKNDVKISQTAITYIQEWLKERIYGVKKEISSKYLNKGLKLEDKAIDKAIEWLDIPFAIKNELFYENDFFTGTPDLIVNDTVYDIKCSWDCFTFPLFDAEIPNSDYFYQLQVYMELTGCKKAVLTYVLLNTPDELTYEEKHDYDNVDVKYRIKTYEINYEPSVIEELKKRVENARNYINTLKIN